MPSAVVQTDPQTRIFDATVKFAIQVQEVEESMVAAILNRLSQIQNTLVLSAENSPFVSPRQTAVSISTLAAGLFNGMAGDVADSIDDISIRGARALPRFLSAAVPSREQIDVDLSPFDVSDVEDEESEENLPFFGLSQEETNRILLGLVWNGLAIRLHWELWIQRQRIQMLNRISAGLAQRQIELVDVDDFEEQLRRETVKIIRRNVAGGRGVRLQNNSAKAGVLGLGRTNLMASINEILRGTFQRNRTLIRAVRWTAILDSRTCLRCVNLDGKTFRFLANGTIVGPQLPLHLVCRCVWIPVLSVRAREQRKRRTAMTFVEWFPSQPESFQRKLLGPMRFALWRSGKLKFKDFVQFRRRVPVRIRTIDSLRKIINA